MQAQVYSASIHELREPSKDFSVVDVGPRRATVVVVHEVAGPQPGGGIVRPVDAEANLQHSDLGHGQAKRLKLYQRLCQRSFRYDRVSAQKISCACLSLLQFLIRSKRTTVR